MAFRLALAFIALLAVASVANAQCATCIGGTCQEWSGDRCSRTCCIEGPGAPCPLNERTFWCPTFATQPSWLVPKAYFTTDLPLITEGSALRLQYTKAHKVQRKCMPLLARRDAA
ncbi:MAG TPA: hypothetical protein VF618_02315 [Thermoanaerobaculia bacterium]